MSSNLLTSAKSTLNRLFHKFRVRIAHISVASAPELGEYEVDCHILKLEVLEVSKVVVM